MTKEYLNLEKLKLISTNIIELLNFLEEETRIQFPFVYDNQNKDNAVKDFLKTKIKEKEDSDFYLFEIKTFKPVFETLKKIEQEKYNFLSLIKENNIELSEESKKTIEQFVNAFSYISSSLNSYEKNKNQSSYTVHGGRFYSSMNFLQTLFLFNKDKTFFLFSEICTLENNFEFKEINYKKNKF